MSATKENVCSQRLPLRTLMFVFLVLGVLVMADIFVTSSWRSSYVIDVSSRLKTDLSKVFSNLMNFDRMQALNGTIGENATMPENRTLPIQTLRNEKMPKEGLSFTSNNTVKIKQVSKTFNITGTIDRSKDEINVATVKYNVFGNSIIKGVTDNKRKDVCYNCFNHNFKYVIDNPDICKLYSGEKQIELLIIILTVHSNVQQRNTLRETWLTYSRNNTASVRYAFLLGEIKDAKLKADIIKESDQFRDIIKEDFVDVYSNLTYKTMMGFKWATTKCGVANAVLKTDDDMYINVPNVLKIVRNNFTDLQSNVVGSCAQTAAPIRNQQSKWFASMNSYPGKFYPGFCSGTGYLTSLKVARKVFEVSPHVPYFHLEDVYVALCIKKLGYHLKGFPGFNPGRPDLDVCLYNGDSLVTAHYMTPAMTKQMWNAKCASRAS